MRTMLLALLWWLGLSGIVGAVEPFDPFQRAGIDQRPGVAAPLDLPLRDEANRQTTLRRLAVDKPILLIPVQYRCRNICGFTLDGLARAINAQVRRPGADFVVVAFGIDPSETTSDAAASLGRLREELAGRPIEGVHAVTGSPAAVREMTGALGYRYAWDPALGQYAHIAAAAVLTPDGRLSSWLYGVDPKPAVLSAAMGAAGKGGLGAVGERLLLLCYHYDPVSGRYAPLAWSLLRGGAVVVTLGLAGFVGMSLRRERRRRRTAT